MNKKQLTIHISRTSVHVAEVFHSNQELKWQKDFELFESNSEGYRAQLKEIFDGLDLASDYDEYSMAWASSKYSLVPLSVFNESSATSVYHLLFGKDVDENTIDFNRLMELSIVDVFEIPDWVKSFFIIRFPRIVFRHEHAITLRALFQMNAFSQKVVVSVMDDYVNISVVRQNELHFSNSFDYQSTEDIIYHLLFVIEKESLNENKGELHLYYNGTQTKSIVEELIEKLTKFKNVEQLTLKDMGSILKLQTLCV